MLGYTVTRVCATPRNVTWFTRLLLGYTVTRVFTSLRNLTWFIRLFLFMRGWGMGTVLNHFQNAKMEAKTLKHLSR